MSLLIKETKKKEGTNDKKKTLTDDKNSSRRKKAIKVGAAVVGTALAAYGAHKASEYTKTKMKLYESGKKYIEQLYEDQEDLCLFG